MQNRPVGHAACPTSSSAICLPFEGIVDPADVVADLSKRQKDWLNKLAELQRARAALG